MKTNKKLNEGIRLAKEGIEECWDDMGGQEMTTDGNGEQMSVTISMPGKNISVTTDSADEIGNILRLAGITLGGDAPMGDVDGDGDHDMTDHAAEVGATEPEVMYVGANSGEMSNSGQAEIEDEPREAVGDTSRTSKGGTVTQTPTGQVHKAGPGNYGGSEEDHEDDTPVPAGAVPEKEEEEVKESGYVNEASGITISGKEVDIASLQVEGVDGNDYPDFSDAYIYQASFKDGTDLNDDELNELNDQHGDLVNELAYSSLHESARILELAGITNEAQSAAQKAAFAKMIAKKNGDKPAEDKDDKDDNKKPDEDGDGVPDWADKDKEVKEEAPAVNSNNNIFGQGVYENESDASRILALAGVAESKLMNSPAGTSMDEPKLFDNLPSGKGTGKGRADFGANRANGQGENPMGDGSHTVSVEEQFAQAMGEYRKFVSENLARKK